VDFTNAVLTVHRTKLGKTRLVPLHETTVEALKAYARVRDRVHPNPLTPFFFVRQRGRGLHYWGLHNEFVLLSRQIGLRGATDRNGPRFHDFRHTFAVNTMVRWYETGVDVERQMPHLSTFLGHTHVADTYWYLSAAPRLLALAAARLEVSQLEEQV
jgi:integrase